MAIPADIKAERGRPILPAWRALLRFIERTGIVRGPGVRLRTGPWGTYVYADADYQPWNHPFLVSASGARIMVGPGMVDGVFPYLDKQPISAIDEEGNAIPAPFLDVDPPSGGVSFVVLEVEPGESGEIVDHPDKTRIIHESERPRPGEPKQALAELHWSGERVRSVFQVVLHNLNFGTSEGATGEAPRAFFWAV